VAAQGRVLRLEADLRQSRLHAQVGMLRLPGHFQFVVAHSPPVAPTADYELSV